MTKKSLFCTIITLTLVLICGLAYGEEAEGWPQSTIIPIGGEEFKFQTDRDGKSFITVLGTDDRPESQRSLEGLWLCPLKKGKTSKTCKVNPKSCFNPELACTQISQDVQFQDYPQVKKNSIDGQMQWVFGPQHEEVIPFGKTTLRLRFAPAFICSQDPTPCLTWEPLKESKFMTDKELEGLNNLKLIGAIIKAHMKAPEGMKIPIDNSGLTTKDFLREDLISYYKAIKFTLTSKDVWMCAISYSCEGTCYH